MAGQQLRPHQDAESEFEITDFRFFDRDDQHNIKTPENRKR